MEASLDDPDADHRETIKRALITTDRPDKTITDLLTLAWDAPRNGDVLDIDAALAGLRARWPATLAAAGRPLRISVAAGVRPTGASEAAATQILDALLDNADAVATDVTNEGPPVAGRLAGTPPGAAWGCPWHADSPRSKADG